MATTVDAVREHLKRDPALADALVRGLARFRRTARWLLEEYGWDTSEEAIVSALRRYAEDHSTSALARPRKLLPQHRVDVQGGLALVTIPRTHEVKTELLEAWESGGARDLFAVLPARKSLRVLVEAHSLIDFRREFSPHTVEETRQPLTALTLAADGKQADVNVASLGLIALRHHGVEVVEVLSSLGESTFIVPDAQRMEAFDVLSELTSPPPRPDQGSTR